MRRFLRPVGGQDRTGTPARGFTGRGAARLAYGTALVLAPDVTAGALAGRRLDRRARLVARVLGVRHIAQALVLRGRQPGSLPRRAGRATDLLHAGSMALLAALAPGWERAALTEATLALLLADRAVPAPPPGPGTRVVGPLPADVFSDERTRARREQDRNTGRQLAIYEALVAMDGEGLEGAKRALRESLTSRGLPTPPGTWLEAVAAELMQGRIYVVSGTSLQDAGIVADRGRPVFGPPRRLQLPGSM